MRRLPFSYIHIFMLGALLFGDARSTRAQEAKADPKLLSDSAIAAAKWDIQPSPRGNIMYLDVPYIRHDSATVLTVTVSKDRTVERPAVVSIMIPAPVERSKDAFLAFATRTTHPDGSHGMVIDTNTRTHVTYQDCNSEFCTIQFKDAYSSGRIGVANADLYADLSKYDFLVLIYFDPMGRENVVVPLSTFRSQYNTLE